MGVLPGLFCPHYDMTESNGVLRSADFEKMLRRHSGERAVAVDLKEACLQRSLLCTIQAEYDEKVAHDASRLKFGLALMADVLEPQQPAAADPASDEVTPELHPVL